MTVSQEILALEEQLRLAELGPDASFFEKHVAENALLDGKRAKAMVVEAHRTGGSAKFSKVEMSDLEVIEHGPHAAVVTCTGHFEGGMGKFSLKFMRVWLKRSGQWQIIAGTVAK